MYTFPRAVRLPITLLDEAVGNLTVVRKDFSECPKNKRKEWALDFHSSDLSSRKCQKNE